MGAERVAHDRTERDGLRSARVVERRIRATEEESAAVLIGPTVAHEHDHGCALSCSRPVRSKFSARTGEVEVELADDPPARNQTRELLEQHDPPDG